MTPQSAINLLLKKGQKGPAYSAGQIQEQPQRVKWVMLLVTRAAFDAGSLTEPTHAVRRRFSSASRL